jgi:hypothetical protein
MRKLIIVAAVVCALVLIAAIPSTSAATTCSGGHVCVWVYGGFLGPKGESLCTGGLHELAGEKLSAINACANKASWLRRGGFNVYCLNPSQYQENTPSFDQVWIGAEGSRCP